MEAVMHSNFVDIYVIHASRMLANIRGNDYQIFRKIINAVLIVFGKTDSLNIFGIPIFEFIDYMIGRNIKTDIIAMYTNIPVALLSTIEPYLDSICIVINKADVNMLSTIIELMADFKMDIPVLYDFGNCTDNYTMLINNAEYDRIDVSYSVINICNGYDCKSSFRPFYTIPKIITECLHDNLFEIGNCITCHRNMAPMVVFNEN